MSKKKLYLFYLKITFLVLKKSNINSFEIKKSIVSYNKFCSLLKQTDIDSISHIGDITECFNFFYKSTNFASYDTRRKLCNSINFIIYILYNDKIKKEIKRVLEKNLLIDKFMQKCESLKLREASFDDTIDILFSLSYKKYYSYKFDDFLYYPLLIEIYENYDNCKYWSDIIAGIVLVIRSIKIDNKLTRLKLLNQ